MPRNLDDFELERTPDIPRDEPEADSPPAEAEPPEPTRYVLEDDTEAVPAIAAPHGSGRLFPMALALFAVVSFAILALVYFIFRPATKPVTPAVSALPGPAPAPPSATSSPAEALPPVELPELAQSDAFVRQAAAGLASDPEVARWLARGALVPTLAAVVVNVVDGESPRPHLEFLAPAQRFRAKGGRNGRIVPDPAGFAGYDRFADAIASVDTTPAVTEYRRLEPLFDAAYRELGHPEGGFGRAVDRALASLLAAPLLDAEVALVPHAIGFRYADPRLEALTAAQKQFLRLGPRNVQKVQAKLREVRAALRDAGQPQAGPQP